MHEVQRFLMEMELNQKRGNFNANVTVEKRGESTNLGNVAVSYKIESSFYEIEINAMQSIYLHPSMSEKYQDFKYIKGEYLAMIDKTFNVVVKIFCK